MNDLDFDSSIHQKRQALRQRRLQEMERRRADRRDRQQQLSQQYSQSQSQFSQTLSQQYLRPSGCDDEKRDNGSGRDVRNGREDDVETANGSSTSSKLSPPMSPDLFASSPATTPPKSAKVVSHQNTSRNRIRPAVQPATRPAREAETNVPSTARTSNRSRVASRNSSHSSDDDSPIRSFSLNKKPSSPAKRPALPPLPPNRSTSGSNLHLSAGSNAKPSSLNSSPITKGLKKSPSSSPSKVTFQNGIYDNRTSNHVASLSSTHLRSSPSDLLHKNSSTNAENNFNSQNSRNPKTTKSNDQPRKRNRWQSAYSSSDSDDDENFDYQEMVRRRRMGERQSSQSGGQSQYSQLSHSRPMSQFSHSKQKSQSSEAITQRPAAAPSAVASDDENDVASVEGNITGINDRKRLSAEQSLEPVDASAASSAKQTSTSIHAKPIHSMNNFKSKTRFCAANYDSSSSEDDMEINRKLQLKLKEQQKERQSAESSKTTENHPLNRSSPEKTYNRHKTPTAPNGRLARSKITSRFTQHSSSESESDPDKEYLEASRALAAKLKADQEAKFKRNPLAMAKREEIEWKERMDNGLVGREVVFSQCSDVVVDDNDMLGTPGTSPGKDLSQNYVRRRSKNSYNNQERIEEEKRDELWDDSDENEGKDSNSDDDGRRNSRGRRKKDTNKNDDAPITQRKRSHSQPKPATKIQGKEFPRKRTSSSKHNSGSSLSDKESGEADPVNRKSKRSGSARMPFVTERKDDEKDALNEDENQLRLQLKPEFTNPKLGPPSELVPFSLLKSWSRQSAGVISGNNSDELVDSDEERANKENDPDDETHQIPASINRYLQDYQREGVQFMYSSVVHGKGCVLGDDMGLGKTVQVISLISALLKKTGTGMDALEIQRNQRKLTELIKAREEEEHRALMTGMYHGLQKPNSKFALPKFAPILIIVPSSVIQNWANEFQTWGYFNVSVYHGESRENGIDRVKACMDFILIAGKGLFTKAADFDNLSSINWKLMIVDEFHEYKNHKSKAYKYLQALRNKCQCPLVGMTGTLMQNNHDELYYLIDLVRPNLLGDRKSFNDYTSKPIKYARAKDAKDDVKQLGKRREEELAKAIMPAYLERKKDVVLKDSLTVKNEKVIFCEMSEIQKKLYRHILSLPDYWLLRMANAPCECGVNQQYFIGYKRMKTQKERVNYQRRHKGEIMPRKKCCHKYPFNPNKEDPGAPQIDPDAVLWRQQHKKIIANPSLIEDEAFDDQFVACAQCPFCVTFSAISKLHKVCSHPSLLQVDRLAEGLDAQKRLEFAKVSLTPDILRELPGGSYFKSDSIMNDHLELSGKMRTLDYCLNKFQRKRNRVLVFSYSTATLDLIQHHIKIKGFTHVRLDGSTPTSQRQSLVDKFQKDESIFVFLISTKAGGLGLNLTAANKVIIFDVNWNPSHDEQAQDRSFRIGQARDVEVVRLVARGTIEELMYARQVYKVQLKKQTLGSHTTGENQPQIFRAVEKDPNRKGELFGLENLFKFKDGSFMQAMWKKSDNPTQAHDVSKISEELSKLNEEEMIEMGEEDSSDKMQPNLGKASEKRTKQPKQKCEETSDAEADSTTGFNHNDFFREDRGRARVVEGEDGFDEELGGESQIVQVTTNLACQMMEASDDDAVGNDLDKQSDERSHLKTIDEGADVIDDEDNYTNKSDPLPENNDNSRSQNANIQNPRTNSMSRSILGDSNKDTSTERTPISKQSAPPKFTLMGVIFSNEKKRNQNKAKKSGVYIPSYAREKRICNQDDSDK